MTRNPQINAPHLAPMSRRQMLGAATCGIGSVALAAMCQDAVARSAGASYQSPLAPKAPHHAPRAKRIIFLHMRGGPAHMDTFDYKPALNKQDGKKSRRGGRTMIGSPWTFRPRGDSGLLVSDLLPHTAQHADDLCVLAGMHTDIGNHTPAMLHLHTGSFVFTRPSMGAWIMYGLGAANANLPGFISMSPPVINGGSKNYGAAFLPAAYQGMPIGDIKTNIKDASVGHMNHPRLPRQTQRKQLDLIQSLNEQAAQADPHDSRISGVIESYERAFVMQDALPRVMDLSTENPKTLEAYGIGDKKPSDSFGRQCLLARRFAEAGVRYIECCDEFWDQHNKLKRGHEARAAATDQPIGALLTDLKQRGLLEDTLVLWGGEFGRTPDKKGSDGRDHNIAGYCMWMAGGGVQGGIKHGATDPLGYKAVDGKVHTHDLHATLLHLLGLDHERLTYEYAGRQFRLTDVHGKIVREILA